MGQQDGKAIEKRDKVKANRSSKLDKLRSGGGGRSGVVSWGECDPRQIARLVYAITEAGGAVMLSVTSDQGALAVTIYDNGDRERIYIPKTANLDEELELVIALWAD